MKAAVYSSFSSPIEIKSIPRPTLTSKDTHAVIIQVLATGVCRSDWHGWKGHDDDIKQHGLPFIPGHELSGIIVEKGSHVSVSSTCTTTTTSTATSTTTSTKCTTNSNNYNNNHKLNVGDRVAIPFILSCGQCTECNINNQPTICLDQQQPGFTCYGSFAEFVKIDRADRNIRHIPDGVTFVEAAALGCRFTTAFRAVVQQGLDLDFNLDMGGNVARVNNTSNSSGSGSDSSSISSITISDSCLNTSTWSKRNNKVVAIFGCGGLGLSCLMIAKAFQMEGKISSIIAIDVSAKALQKAVELGADHVINASSSSHHMHKTNNNRSFVKERVLELTNGLGAEVSIDAAGFKATCENALYCTRRGCRMIQVGLPIGGSRPVIDMGFVAAREITIVGSHGFAANDLPSLLTLVQEGRLDVNKLIEKEVTLEEGIVALMNMDKTSPLGMTMITKFGDPVSCKL